MSYKRSWLGKLFPKQHGSSTCVSKRTNTYSMLRRLFRPEGFDWRFQFTFLVRQYASNTHLFRWGVKPGWEVTQWPRPRQIQPNSLQHRDSVLVAIGEQSKPASSTNLRNQWFVVLGPSSRQAKFSRDDVKRIIWRHLWRKLDLGSWAKGKLG